jgi:hypothetical protein
MAESLVAVRVRGTIDVEALLKEMAKLHGDDSAMGVIKES